MDNILCSEPILISQKCNTGQLGTMPSTPNHLISDTITINSILDNISQTEISIIEQIRSIPIFSWSESSIVIVLAV